MDHYGKLLRAWRKACGFSLARVADALGVSVPYLSDVERGRRGPFSIERNVAVSRLLQQDPKQLIVAIFRDGGAVEVADPGREPDRVAMADFILGARQDTVRNDRGGSGW